MEKTLSKNELIAELRSTRKVFAHFKWSRDDGVVIQLVKKDLLIQLRAVEDNFQTTAFIYKNDILIG